MRRLTHGVVGLALALAMASPAGAAEIETRTPGTVTATRGQVTAFELAVSATDPISCTTSRDNPARAQFETQVSLVAGRVVNGGRPGTALPFYADGAPNLGGVLTCGTAWDTKPAPYTLAVNLAVAPDTPAGTYSVPLEAKVSNPGFAGFAPLADSQPGAVSVRVEDPPPPPAGLPDPRENRSVNLLPVRGKVFVRYPRASSVVRIDDPVQVPVGTKVDTAKGFVDLVSDSNARGGTQQATFWNGRFSVAYTRAVVPGTRSRRAGRPITELTVARTCGSAARASAGRHTLVGEARRRRRRGLFGRGRGRFRTRGRYGAGTVRGTHWHFENNCRFSLVEVFSGVVGVRDFGRRRTFNVRRGQGYLALPSNARKGSSVG